jgi:hypothetical protein
VIFEHLPEALRANIRFVENDWSLLESGEWLDDCDLLVLNLIGGSCDIPHPGAGAERAVRSYCEHGGNALLLHGSSAAFWQWDWWRQIVGFRWVRPNDPDNIPRSVHPTKPYALRLTKCRHPLMAQLQPFELPSDELYTELEQVCPTMVMMDTAISEGVYPQCFENLTPWGGKFIGFLPGHRPEATGSPALIHNITALINYLRK